MASYRNFPKFVENKPITKTEFTKWLKGGSFSLTLQKFYSDGQTQNKLKISRSFGGNFRTEQWHSVAQQWVGSEEAGVMNKSEMLKWAIKYKWV